MSTETESGLYNSNHSPSESETADGFCMISFMTTERLYIIFDKKALIPSYIPVTTYAPSEVCCT